MKTVKIGELRNQLSSYLQDVRKGEEIIVCDRDKPVAQIVPIRELDDFDSEQAELIARGILRPPKNPEPIDWTAFDALPAPEVSTEASKAAIDWAKGER